MPSTYTDRLGLELQANGENLNTWGTKANTVFKLLEEAVSGYVALTISGNTTLTITDGTEASGATDQARNAFLKLTGTPGAAFTLTLPEVEKAWVIWNDSDGEATLKTVTDTTSVTLPVNRIVIVQSDGAGNVFQVTPIIADNVAAAQNQSLLTTDSVTFAGATIASLIYPSSDGSAGQYLTTDGSGNLSFGTPAGAGDVLASANLSDLDDIPTARSNLGLGYASEVQAEAGTNNATSMTPLRTAQAIGALTPRDYEEFTASGTWTKPDNVQFVYVEAIGGGGGGHNATGDVDCTGGGGGEFVGHIFQASALGATETVTIGAGGSGGAASGNNTGAAGGDTTFGSHLTAKGGRGGINGTSHVTAPRATDASISSSTGSLGGVVDSFAGYGSAAGAGGNTVYGGAGGGAAQSSASGGTSEFGGNGGAGNDTASTKAGNGVAPGGGGGGSANDGGGGDGAAGRVRVWAW